MTQGYIFNGTLIPDQYVLAPKISAGDHVRVTHGPYEGFTGTVDLTPAFVRNMGCFYLALDDGYGSAQVLIKDLQLTGL
jgi:hypothetical protein